MNNRFSNNSLSNKGKGAPGPRTSILAQHVPEEYYIGDCIDGEKLYCDPKYKEYVLSNLSKILKSIEDFGIGEYRPVMISTLGGIAANLDKNLLYDTFELDVKKELAEAMSSSYDKELESIYLKFISGLNSDSVNNIFDASMLNSPKVSMKINFISPDGKQITVTNIEEYKDKDLNFLNCTYSKESSVLTITVEEKSKENLIQEDDGERDL